MGCENSFASSSSSFSSSSSDPSTPHPQQSERQMIKHQNMAVLPIAQKTCWLHSLGTISCKLVGYNLWLACLLVGYKLLVQFLACLLACWVQALGTISCLLACLLVTSSWYNNLLLACLFVGYSLVMLS